MIAALIFSGCGDGDPVSSVDQETIASPAIKLTTSSTQAGGYRVDWRGARMLRKGVLVEDEITSPSLEGNPLGDPATRKVMVYLPPSYEISTDVSYPTVYLLHGYSGNAMTFISPEEPSLYLHPDVDFPEGGLPTLLDELIAGGAIEEMIAVMPDASNAFGGSWYTNSALSGNYEDYISGDLVNFIDANYRTIPDSESRGIIGHSMGGYGAFTLAIKHPDVFSVTSCLGGGPLVMEAIKPMIPAVIAENPDGLEGPQADRLYTNFTYGLAAAFSPNLLNPPFYVDLFFEFPSGEIVEEVWGKWIENDPFSMVATHGENLVQLRGIYLDAGDKDDFVNNIPTEMLHQALVEAGIEHQFQIYDGTHFNRIYETIGISLVYTSKIIGE